MHEYRVPAAAGNAAFTERRSRFLGSIWRVETEQAALARIKQTRAKYHDATHNCYCYILRETGTERFSDDGEPQGTAGLPMLEVFRREALFDVCCVVTRYFGGILLGAGGLVRAYAQAAKEALNAVGICTMRPFTGVQVPCPYHLLKPVQAALAAALGVVEGIDYAEKATIYALLPADQVDRFLAQLTERSAGTVSATVTDTRWRPVPI